MMEWGIFMTRLASPSCLQKKSELGSFYTLSSIVLCSNTKQLIIIEKSNIQLNVQEKPLYMPIISFWGPGETAILYEIYKSQRCEFLLESPIKIPSPKFPIYFPFLPDNRRFLSRFRLSSQFSLEHRESIFFTSALARRSGDAQFSLQSSV